MSNIPRISETEWVIMKILWKKSPLTANQVIEELDGTVDWSPLTIRTLLGRLVKKGALESPKVDGIYHYAPAISEKECVGAESRNFLKRVYNGAFKSMMANFLEEQQLSEDEIAELKRILEDKKPEKR